ncbi:hypothetical protein RHMOL_Rhmol09G0069800 [Rhododendron molle]|uniref:Uncharacterized protein n=1 Tax=Rhododendron molle TaxID=49168 RepID=A0ACC0MBS9_RHOML|nr:hypothetical protein RHMOL_Rhmol09G0069800 [Rhododendron molle]
MLSTPGLWDSQAISLLRPGPKRLPSFELKMFGLTSHPYCHLNYFLGLRRLLRCWSRIKLLPMIRNRSDRFKSGRR